MGETSLTSFGQSLERLFNGDDGDAGVLTWKCEFAYIRVCTCVRACLCIDTNTLTHAQNYLRSFVVRGWVG